MSRSIIEKSIKEFEVYFDKKPNGGGEVADELCQTKQLLSL